MSDEKLIKEIEFQILKTENKDKLINDLLKILLTSYIKDILEEEKVKNFKFA
jgi:hypothetical protein